MFQVLGIILGNEHVKLMQIGFVSSGSAHSKVIVALFCLLGAFTDAVNQYYCIWAL